MEKATEYLTPWLVIGVQGLLVWALWTVRRAFVRGDEYLRHVEHDGRLRQEADSRAASLEARVHVLEDRLALVPDARTLADLAAAVESLRGDVKTVDMRITGVDRLMQRLERALDRQEAARASS